MKRNIIFILFAILLFSACGTVRQADVYNLSAGMTQNQVNNIMGNPVRILSSSYTQDGRVEVFEYHTYRREAYAIEFYNGRMERYDFLYEDIPPVTVNPVYPVYPSPNPVRPVQPTKPGNGNTGTTRPPTNGTGSRPNTNTGTTTRPGTNNPDAGRPKTDNPTTRPTNSGGTTTSSDKSSSTSDRTRTNTEERQR